MVISRHHFCRAKSSCNVSSRCGSNFDDCHFVSEVTVLLIVRTYLVEARYAREVILRVGGHNDAEKT